MKTTALAPARLSADADGVPLSLDYGDIYHPKAGAFVQARHVFIAGNGLPQRWRGRDRFVVLETGFGLGNNFLATWEAWRADAQRCGRLVFLAIERHPLQFPDMRQVHARSPVPELAAALVAAWPPSTPNLHRLVFDGGQVQLLLALGDVAAWLPELVATVDAFFLDGFAPARNPQMWQPRLFKAMGRIAAHAATVATWTAARGVREGLTSAGFVVRSGAGTGGKRDITLAEFAPAFLPRRPPARRAFTAPASRHALIVGAGLAGCAVAAALAEHGWRSTLVDRHAEPAQEASGNPGGLFHGVVHAQDGHHARFNRAAALEAARAIRQLLAQAGPMGGRLGEVGGLLRLETGPPDVGAMRAMLHRLGLPPDHVQALDAADAGALAGLPLSGPAWFYPAGGWVRPAALARAWLQSAGSACDFAGDIAVDRLHHDGEQWQLRNANGRLVASAPVAVLANADDAIRLLAQLGGSGRSRWPLMRVRGQLTVIADPARHGLPVPRIPVAGAGYVLPGIDGQLVFGATAQPDDGDPAVRMADHQHNLARLAQLSPAMAHAAREWSAGDLTGRTAWRSVASDRLPLVGAVPEAWIGGVDGGWDQPRFVPRAPGLYLFNALGSRGITWASLGAQVLAAAVTGGPAPLESSLLDAIDPARFLCRAARRRVADLVNPAVIGPVTGAE